MVWCNVCKAWRKLIDSDTNDGQTQFEICEVCGEEDFQEDEPEGD